MIKKINYQKNKKKWHKSDKKPLAKNGIKSGKKAKNDKIGITKWQKKEASKKGTQRMQLQQKKVKKATFFMIYKLNKSRWTH